ncbi:Arc family DNA-binding protein [candidate division KSB1 bacterium]|nr:Arc family DNA-binding protein [candidate division KSB1 bacterium]
MPAITLKNIPADLYDEIKKNADINFRSINGEILFRLKKSIGHKKTNPELLISKIEAIQAKIKAPDLTDEILYEAKNMERP